MRLALNRPVLCHRSASAAEDRFESDLERQLEGELALEELTERRRGPDKAGTVGSERRAGAAVGGRSVLSATMLTRPRVFFGGALQVTLRQ